MRPDKKKKPYKGKGKETQPPTQSNPHKEKDKLADTAVSHMVQVDFAAKQTPVPEVKAMPSASSSPCGKSLKQDNGDHGAEADEPLATGSKIYSKRKVFSNWERYAEPERDMDLDYEENQGLDFEKLLQAPISAEGHFVFKSEKLEPPPSGNLFALDLKTLSDGLRTIPFYKQLQLSQSLFSAADIEGMDRQAAIYSVPSTERLQSREPAPTLASSSKPISPKQVKSHLTELSGPPSVSVNPASQFPPPDVTLSSSLKPKTHIETNTERCKEITAHVSIPLPDETAKDQRERKTQKSDSVKPEKSPPLEMNTSSVLTASDETSLSSLLDKVDVCADIKPKTAVPSIVANAATPQVNDDLEAWLDSVLDD